MTQYAYFNSSVASPSPVIGWYDTAEFDYPNLPSASDLLEVTAAQWAARIVNPSGWAVSNGALVAYTPPVPPPTLAQQAAAALGAGLAITSTGTPAINGTYPCDNTAQARFSRVYELIQRAGGSAFPAGMTELPWALADGSIVKFASVSTFFAVEQAVGEYVLALDLIIATGTGTLPAATATIP